MLQTWTLNKNTSLPIDRLIFWGRNFKMTPISKYSVAHERRNMGTSNDIHTLGIPNLRSTTKTTRLKNSWSKAPVVLVSQTLTPMTLLVTTPAKSTDISATFYQRERSHKTNPTAPFGKCFHSRIRTQNCARDCTVANLTAGVTSFTAICEINKGEHTAEQKTKADVSGSILPALKTLFRGCVHPLFAINNHLKLSITFRPSAKRTYTLWAATVYPTAFTQRTPTVRPRSLCCP